MVVAHLRVYATEECVCTAWSCSNHAKETAHFAQRDSYIRAVCTLPASAAKLQKSLHNPARP